MRKKIIFDSIFNIVAAAIPLIALQFLILPYLGKSYGKEEYGIIITLLSVSALFSQPLGNVLNNVRLINNQEYNEKKINGDYSIILIFMIVINLIFVIIGTVVTLNSFYFFIVILITLYSTLNLVREYSIVTFRINLNFKKILYSNIFLTLGYLVGFAVYLLIGFWQVIYIVGLIVSIIYIDKNSNIFRESRKTTSMLKKTVTMTVIMFFSGFLKSSIKHVDKFVLLLLLGSASVSIYYTSTFAGKFLSLAITPISGVLLSYFSKMKKMKRQLFFQFLIALIIIGVTGYFVILLISPVLIRLLYPDWASDSILLISITTATAVITSVQTVINPVILKFKHIKWQLIINGINFVLSIMLSVLLLFANGLTGFVTGILVANIIVLIIKVIVFIFGDRNNELLQIEKNISDNL